MKKLAFGILCMAAAILLMSHNTTAIDFNINVSRLCSNYTYSKLKAGNNNTDWLEWSMTHSVAYGGWVAGDNDLYSIETSLNFYKGCSTAKFGDILELDFTITNNNNNDGLDTYIWSIGVDSVSRGYEFISSEYEQLDASNGLLKIYLHINTNGNPSNGWNLLLASGNSPTRMGHLWANETMIFSAAIIYRPVSIGGSSSFDDTDIINAINSLKAEVQNTNTSISDVVDGIQEQNEKEQEAVDNIADQTPSDISSSGNTENQASTNLIGAFSNFVSALTNIQTGNCNITLGFPDYAGGSRTVNICQNKDKAGNLISVFSSLTLIVFYIPLAIRLLTMIYNEIRSYTNG